MVNWGWRGSIALLLVSVSSGYDDELSNIDIPSYEINDIYCITYLYVYVYIYIYTYIHINALLQLSKVDGAVYDFHRWSPCDSHNG